MSSSSKIKMWHGEKEREVFELYSEDLDRLTINSKPVISNLTELAEEYKINFAPLIVRIIEDRIKNVPAEQKLPQLYLLDSIVKNHTNPYAALFQQNIVSVFAGVFQACPNEKIRAQLFKLRSTWGTFFAHPKLNQLDRRVKEIDPAWPVQDSRNRQVVQQAPPAQQSAPAAAPKIHVNPKMVNPDFIKQHKLPPQSVVAAASASSAAAPPAPEDEIARMKQELERLKQEKIKMQIQKAIEEEKKTIEELKKVEDGKKKVNNTVEVVAPPTPPTKQPSTSSSSSAAVKVCTTKVPSVFCKVFYQNPPLTA